MHSPFPGMDPYLEQFWPDLHARLILYACDQIEEQLPSNLIARVEERVVLETQEDPHAVYPDVKITARAGRGLRGVPVARQAAVIEPVIVPYHGEPAVETFLNILEAGPAQRLITVIEVLSLATKLAGDGQRLYRRKQYDLANAGVSLVEIDLLRQGRRVLNVPPSRIPRQCANHVPGARAPRVAPGRVRSLSAAAARTAAGDPHSAARAKDEDIQLDLQAVLEQAYRKGRYALTINYADPPDPPLSGNDAKWAKALVKAARKKPT